MSKQLSDLNPNAKNPRKVTDKKLQLLKKSLEEHGDLSGFVFNRRTGQLAGGHQRQKSLPSGSKIVITKRYDAPTKAGTVADGFVLVGEERFAYREVDWTEQKEKAANIAANKGAGEWDLKLLGNWLEELKTDGFDMDLTMFDADELGGILGEGGGPGGEGGEDIYTKKIKAPVYEPKGEKPKEKELYDQNKALQLLAKIDRVEIPAELRSFLEAAAARHVVFDYEKIAEYYCHAPKEIQGLMEESALVIIDFQKAIEGGFVTMSKEIAEGYGDE